MKSSGQSTKFPAPIYRDTVLAPVFADAKRYFLEPLLEIEYAHTLMLAKQGIMPGNEAAATLFILERENVPVGWGGFVRSQALDGQEMELICAIIPACRRENLATEACGALVTWALESRLWPRILACVHCSNERGLALASRLGFREIGRRVSDPNVRVLERAAG